MKLLFIFILEVFFTFPALAAPALELSVNPQKIETHSNKYYYYNFGNVRVNWSEWTDIYLRNTGPQPLSVRGIFVTGSAFWAWSNCPNWLAPGQSCVTRVEFRPWHEGSFSGRLRYSLGDGNIYVDLFGWGTRW